MLSSKCPALNTIFCSYFSESSSRDASDSNSVKAVSTKLIVIEVGVGVYGMVGSSMRYHAYLGITANPAGAKELATNIVPKVQSTTLTEVQSL